MHLPHLSQPPDRRNREEKETLCGKQAHENETNQGSKDTSENKLLKIWFLMAVFLSIPRLTFFPQNYITTYRYLGDILITHRAKSLVLPCHNLHFDSPMFKHPCFHWALAPALQYYPLVIFLLLQQSNLKLIFLPLPICCFPFLVALVMESAECPSVR